jgi:hypothetical protein
MLCASNLYFLRLNRKERLFLDYLDFNNYVILEGLGGA